MVQSKAVVATGFPDGFAMAFGYRLVSVGVSVGDTANTVCQICAIISTFLVLYHPLVYRCEYVGMHLYANKLFFILDPFTYINSFHRIRCFQCTVPAKWPQGLQTHHAKTDWFCTGN